RVLPFRLLVHPGRIQLGLVIVLLFFFSSRRRHTRFKCDWSSDVCSSDLFFLHASMGCNLPAPNGLFAARSTATIRRTISCSKARSEERRVGKECRSRWWLDH